MVTKGLSRVALLEFGELVTGEELQAITKEAYETPTTVVADLKKILGFR